MIYKVGGWYADLDMVFLKSLKDLKNTLASDNFERKHILDNPDHLGGQLCNAIFHFDKHHLFLEKCMAAFPKIFDGRWGSGGPKIFSQSLKSLCKTSEIEILRRKNINKDNCDGIEVQRPT